MESCITVSGLRKSYGDFEAVRGIDFEVAQGEVFGLLGPNGAGKTTTIEILEGLRTRSAGDVRVLGFDPAVDVHSIKDRIGVCLQATNLPEKIRLHEAMTLFASFYPATSTATSFWLGSNSPKSATPSTPPSPAARSSVWPSPWL